MLAMRCHINCVVALLEKGIDANTKIADYNEALMMSAEKEKAACVSLNMENTAVGLDVNVNIALLEAAQEGHTEFVRVPVDSVADARLRLEG